MTVPRPDDDDWTRRCSTAIDDGVGLVAVPNCTGWTAGCSTSSGSARPRGPSARCWSSTSRSRSARCRSTSRACGPTSCSARLYKWLLGPYSIGLRVVRARSIAAGRRHRAQLDLARRAARTSRALVDDADALQPGARRYDVGERANFALLPAATVAFNCIAGWGAGRASAPRSRRLNERIAEARRELDVVVPVARPHRAGHLLGLRLPGGAPEDLAARLAAARRVRLRARRRRARGAARLQRRGRRRPPAGGAGGRRPRPLSRREPSCSIRAWIGATCCERPLRSSSS